jgi:hypothetical protein
VERHRDRIRVFGTNRLVAPVCAAVVGEDNLGPPDLRVHHPDLEDALIALISDTETNPSSDVAASRPLQGAA